MPPHPYFDLELLDDDVLHHYLPAPIIARNTIHEWPLSCVHHLTCLDGSQYIYKSQAHPPSVEAAVYRVNVAPHLLPATIINDKQLILPFVANSALTRDRTTTMDSILGHIAMMSPHTPVYRLLDTLEAWHALVQSTTHRLHELVHTNAFHRLTLHDIARINMVAHHAEIHALWHGQIGIVHGDVTSANLLHTPTHTYVIDWQRPLYAPTVIDRLMIERTLQLPTSTPPYTHALCAILEIAWLTDAATCWFPAGMAHYDEQIHALVQQL